MTTNAELQRRATRLVSQEVHSCMSSLVATLAYGFPSDLDGLRARDYPGLVLREQALELAAPVLDYEGAAREAGWECVDREGFPPGTQFHDTTDGMNWPCAGWEKLCADHDIEPHDLEVYEHWAVSPWLAEKLIAKGEKVDTDFAGLCVWARTTTGQAIAADNVVLAIVSATGYASGGEG